MKIVSSNRIMAKEELAALRPWVLDSFAPRNARADVVPAAVATAQVHEEARRLGYDQGYRAGLAAANAQAEREAARLAQMLDALRIGIAALDAQTARDTVELAIAIARQVVRKELSARPEAIVAVVMQALDCLPHDTQDAQLHLSPDDAELIKEQIGVELERKRWRIVANADISPGGCRIEAHSADVDARLESRWADVLAALENSHAS